MRASLLSEPARPRFAGRAFTKDAMTYGNQFRTHDSDGNAMGKRLGVTVKTADGRTCDSTGAFYVGELERLDMKMHEPLAAVTWGRDIDLREDVTIADDVSSFTLSTFGSVGGLGTGNSIGNGKAWVGKNATEIAGLSVDIAKIPHPLRPWALELAYTIFELEAAAKLGRPIDQQKWQGLQLKHQMDTDEQVYIGDLTTGDTGLLNNSLVTDVNNLPNGAGGHPQWTTKTPQEILADVNFALTTVWAASAWAVMPKNILIPPAQYGYISTQLVSTAGSQSILKYLRENNLIAQSVGPNALEIYPVKWAIGSGAGGTIGTLGTVDRMTVYTRDIDRVRFPMTMLQRTPVQYDGLYHKCTYFGRLGVVEVVYPETVGYFDGL